MNNKKIVWDAAVQILVNFLQVSTVVTSFRMEWQGVMVNVVNALGMYCTLLEIILLRFALCPTNIPLTVHTHVMNRILAFVNGHACFENVGSKS